MSRSVRQNILLISFTLMVIVVSAHETFGTFKDWDVMPHQVIGILKLTDTHGRAYYNITAVDENTVKVERITAQGIINGTNIVTFQNGTLSQMIRSDQWGNVYQVVNYTTLGNEEFMVTSMSSGQNDFLPAKQAKYTYVNDLLAEIKYISFDGSICNGPEGVAIEKITRYDDAGRITGEKEHAYFNEEGEPVLNKEQDYHKAIFEMDERGNTIAGAFFDEKGRPALSRYGSYRFVKTYDANDNEIDYRNLNTEGQMVNELLGVARAKSECKDGLLVKRTYYNAANKIARQSDAGSGVAISKYEYDERGNLVKESYYDENGRPLNQASGIQHIIHKYSDSNMELAIEYFDKDGQPAINDENIHLYTYSRDNLGRIAAAAFFDKYYSPVENREHQVNMVKYKYDSAGLLISQSFWKNETTKMLRWDGYHEERFKYNSQGQETERDNYDVNGNPAKAETGYSRLVTIYNPNCQVSQRLVFNGDKPALMKNSNISNYHSVRLSYDKRNKVAVIEYFDTRGNATNATFSFEQEFYGSRVELVYKGDQIMQEKIYVINGKSPVKIIDCFKGEYINTAGIGSHLKNRAD